MILNYLDFPNIVKDATIEISDDKTLKISIEEDELLNSTDKIKYILFEIYDNSFGVPSEWNFRLNVSDSKDFISVIRSLLIQIVKDGGK